MSDLFTPEEDRLLARTLAHTILWCSHQPHYRSEPTQWDVSWRTQALAPSGVTPQTEDLWEDVLGPQRGAASVRQVARRRANAIEAHNLGWRDERPGGRLMALTPGQSDASGAAEPETAGFFSYEDVPPWDTWVMFWTIEAELPASPLLSWVPTPLIPLVAQGIGVMPTYPVDWFIDASLEQAIDALFAAWGLPPIDWYDGVLPRVW